MYCTICSFHSSTSFSSSPTLLSANFQLQGDLLCSPVPYSTSRFLSYPDIYYPTSVHTSFIFVYDHHPIASCVLPYQAVFKCHYIIISVLLNYFTVRLYPIHCFLYWIIGIAYILFSKSFFCLCPSFTSTCDGNKISIILMDGCLLFWNAKLIWIWV